MITFKITHKICVPFLFVCIVFFLSNCGNKTNDEKTLVASTNNHSDHLFADQGIDLKAEREDIDLEKLHVPTGFKIELFAADVKHARSLAMSPKGIVYVGSRSKKGSVKAVVDTNNDGIADKKFIIDEELTMPNGVAWYEGDLYVAEISRILKYKNIDDNLENPGEPEVVYDKYPDKRHHGWKYIAFGPDGKLYVPVGAPCNICESEDPVFASITRMNPDGTNMEIYARGIRNTVGFDWHPKTGKMYFTDNGRDMLGDEKPDCELNSIDAKGEHFGYPYCHQGDILDPEFGSGKDCADYKKPDFNLGPHVAPLGITFYTGDRFHASYKNQIFVAEHGSWNRSKKIGYRVKLATFNEDGSPKSYERFIDGWLDEESQEAWGRPVDIIEDGNGGLLISDDKAGCIYKVSAL